MTNTTAVRHACARCRRMQPADQMVYSTHTKLHYCRNFGECDRLFMREVRAHGRQQLAHVFTPEHHGDLRAQQVADRRMK